MTPTFFEGEIQFRRYSDTSTQGQQVVFSVQDRDALSPFIGMEGRRFMAVLVMLGDDETPVEPPPKRDQRGPLCREACDLCELDDFWAWVESRGTPCSTEASAKKYVLAVCDVESRKHLDQMPYAAQLFKEFIRIPFMKWMRERKAA